MRTNSSSLCTDECMAFLASGSGHTVTVSARAIRAYLQLALGTTKIGKRYSLGQAPKSTANAVANRASRAAIKKIISDKKKHVILTHAQLDDTQS